MNLLLAAMVAVQSLDAGSSAVLLARGGYREANPMFGTSSPTVVVVEKALVTTGAVCAIRRLAQHHPKWAVVAAVGVSVSGALAFEHNRRLMGGTTR